MVAQAVSQFPRLILLAAGMDRLQAYDRGLLRLEGRAAVRLAWPHGAKPSCGSSDWGLRIVNIRRLHASKRRRRYPTLGAPPLL